MSAVEAASSPHSDRGRRADRTFVRWLAAYTIGLAYSRCGDGECVQRLRAVVPSSAVALERVRQQISRAPAVLPQARERALWLLEQVADRNGRRTADRPHGVG